MEFVIVTCDNEQRSVFIDNQEQGMTDDRLSVPEGLHVFDLGAPQNYAPPFQEVLIEKTTSPEPLVIPFTLIAQEARRKHTKRKTTGTRRKIAKASSVRRSRKKTSTKKKSTKQSTKKTSAKSSRKKR
jgi:hypothetical protein